MKALNLASLALIIIGGLNWGLVGFFEWDLVSALFGSGSFLARTVYSLVGLSALWQIAPLVSALRGGQANSHTAGSAH